jgi:hypothetical protein
VQIERGPLRRLGSAVEVAADIDWLVSGGSLTTGLLLMPDARLHPNMNG